MLAGRTRIDHHGPDHRCRGRRVGLRPRPRHELGIGVQEHQEVRGRRACQRVAPGAEAGIGRVVLDAHRRGVAGGEPLERRHVGVVGGVLSDRDRRLRKRRSPGWPGVVRSPDRWRTRRPGSQRCSTRPDSSVSPDVGPRHRSVRSDEQYGSRRGRCTGSSARSPPDASSATTIEVHGPGFASTPVPAGAPLLLLRNARRLTRGRREAGLLRRASPGVYDLDDGLPWDDGNLPGLGHWAKRPFPRSLTARRAAAAADRVVVGNDVLAEWAVQHCADVRDRADVCRAGRVPDARIVGDRRPSRARVDRIAGDRAVPRRHRRRARRGSSAHGRARRDGERRG